MRMNLDDYLTITGTKGVDFALAIGVSEASLTRIRRGEQNISRDLIRRIVEATNGLVTSDDLVFPAARHGLASTAAPDAASPGKGGEISPRGESLCPPAAEDAGGTNAAAASLSGGMPPAGCVPAGCSTASVDEVAR